MLHKRREKEDIMRTSTVEEHSNNFQPSVLEKAVEEKNAEHFAFDTMIADPSEFDLTLLTRPDDYIIRLHDYLMRQLNQISFASSNPEHDPKITRINNMLSRLEDIPAVQEHINQQTDKQVEETVALVAERQRVRKMGPLQRLFYERMKKRKQ